LRRTAQLSRDYPNLVVVDIRGNLNTRLKKLDLHCTLKKDESESCESNTNKTNLTSNGNICIINENTTPNYVALILANAGLVRMGWQDRISQVKINY
jgi:hydroxymethylbilane synthase